MPEPRIVIQGRISRFDICPTCKQPHAWADPSDPCEFEVGQIWRKRSSLPGIWRFKITRLAGHTAFGDVTVSTLPFGGMKGQKRYTQLRAKWDLEEAER